MMVVPQLLLLCLLSSPDAVLSTLVDMSHPYNDGQLIVYPDFWDMRFNISHRGWLNLPNGDKAWLEHNSYCLPEHLGTHMDAPAHFSRTPGKHRLHEIPIEKFIGDAIVLDITHKADVERNPDALVEVEDIVRFEEEHGRIPEDSIIFYNSGWDAYWGDERRFLGNDRKDTSDLHHPGFSGEAAQWLVDNRRPKGIGCDTISFDAGNALTFPAHRIFLTENIYGLENVKNLGVLPPMGARVYVFPINVYDGSGGPTRIIAEYYDGRVYPPMPHPSGGRALTITSWVVGVAALIATLNM